LWDNSQDFVSRPGERWIAKPDVRFRPIADVRISRFKLVSMSSAWPTIRYWAALCASLLLTLAAFSGLGMGGPRGAIGWTVFALCLTAPVAIWLTRWNRAAQWLQDIALTVVLLLVAYVLLILAYTPPS
jgi:hypothetical protein